MNPVVEPPAQVPDNSVQDIVARFQMNLRFRAANYDQIVVALATWEVSLFHTPRKILHHPPTSRRSSHKTYS